MASYDATPTLSQTISAGLMYANNIIGIGLDIQKEKARSDLLHMQAQYDTDQNDFLTKLSNEADYQKYEEYYLQFVNNIGNQFTNKDSPYYCDNSFTQKKANEMLESQKVALRNKVSEMMNTKAMQDIMATDKETARQNRTNLSAPEATKANSALYTNWFSHGWIDRDTYNNLLLSEQTLTYNAAIDSLYNSNVDAAIASGLTGKEFWDQIEKNHPELNDLEVNVISTGMANPENAASGNGVTAVKMSPDSERYKAIKNNFLQNYDTSVASMQEKNYTKLSEMYSKLSTIEDPVQRLNYCRNALNTISTQMQGNRLNDQRRISYVNLFKGEIDDITRAAKSGSNSSNLDKYADMINGDEKTFMALVEEGKLNFIDASEAYQNKLAEVWFSTGEMWKETEKIPADKRTDYFMAKYGRAGVDNFLNNKVLMDALNRPEYKALKDKYTAITKDIEADWKKPLEDRKFTADSMNILGSFITSFVAQNGTGLLSKEAVEEQEAFLNNMYLDQLQKNFTDYNNTTDRGIINGINILNKNDVVKIDNQGNEIWASKDAKEKVEEIAGQQQEVIARSIDLDTKQLEPHGYLKTAYDEKPIPVFKYGKDLYHLELTADGKSYDVVDQNGNHYAAVTVEEQKYSYKQDKKESAAAKKEALTELGKTTQERGEKIMEEAKSHYTPNQQKRFR